MSPDNKPPKAAVLLVNLGSPDAPTTQAVRRYLHQFLSDPRVVSLPKILWWPILWGLILPFRSRQSAAKYQKIWRQLHSSNSDLSNTDLSHSGSPLIEISQRQAEKLATLLAADDVSVYWAMRYGQPSLSKVMAQISRDAIDELLILPLYPQYSATTTASVFDEVARLLKQQVCLPTCHFVRDYYHEADYIALLAKRIADAQAEFEIPDKLIFSYHGLPQAHIDAGDIYYQQCLDTTARIAAYLNLPKDAYLTTFQSRLSRAWVKPYTDQVLIELAQTGCKTVHIISPAFASDCLETLEELQIECHETFKQHGGETYRYLPALNDDQSHLVFLRQLVQKYLARSLPRTP